MRSEERAYRRAAEVLLVEDNPADVRLIEEMIRELDMRCRLSVALDGDEALRFLHREGSFRDVARPDLILLDLNLPILDGRELLRELKREAALGAIPVLVLTTSSSPEDIRTCYELQASGYLVKPFNLESYRDLMRAINAFWLEQVEYPDPPGGR